MNSLFNTPFELSIRVLLLVYTYNQPISFKRILISDFITTYGKDFGISAMNLNGDNTFRFSEFIARRSLIQQAIKSLVIQELLNPTKNEFGFSYSLTKSGKEIIPQFVSIYAEKYLETAYKTKKFLGNKSETAVLKEINERAQALRGE